MSPLKYRKTASIGKLGINFIANLTLKANCIFHEIPADNDIGIDAWVEIIINETPINSAFAMQIKSGSSYFDSKESICKIPIKQHRQYWENYHLPVYGIVHDPNKNEAYWIDVKKYLKYYPSATYITYSAHRANVLNESTFASIFINQHIGNVPDIPYDTAKEFFKSSESEEFYLGLWVLFKKYGYNLEVWSLFSDYFVQNQFDKIPKKLIYYLSFCPWHPDIFSYKDSFTTQSRNYGRLILSKYGKEEVIKLLTFIDPNLGLHRGSVGQSAEAIISINEKRTPILESIVTDSAIDYVIREAAAELLAYYEGLNCINIVQTLTESDRISMIIDFMKEFNQNHDPYY